MDDTELEGLEFAEQAFPTATDYGDTPAQTMNISEPERIISLLGGMGLIGLGLSRRSLGGLGLAAIGGLLVERGWTGHSRIYRALGITTHRGNGERADTVVRKGVKVRLGTTIDRPAHELYRVWREFEDLPRFMTHLESVTTNGENLSHWVAKGPLDKTLEWDAEIIADRANEVISWRSLPDADVDCAGSVRFDQAPSGRGTEVRIQFNYAPPAGRAGAVAAWFFGKAAQQQVEEDVQHFKSFMESGTIPTSQGQSHGPPAN